MGLLPLSHKIISYSRFYMGDICDFKTFLKFFFLPLAGNVDPLCSVLFCMCVCVYILICMMHSAQGIPSKWRRRKKWLLSFLLFLYIFLIPIAYRPLISFHFFSFFSYCAFLVVHAHSTNMYAYKIIAIIVVIHKHWIIFFIKKKIK